MLSPFPILRPPAETPYPILPPPASLRVWLHSPTHSCIPTLTFPNTGTMIHKITKGHFYQLCPERKSVV